VGDKWVIAASDSSIAECIYCMIAPKKTVDDIEDIEDIESECKSETDRILFLPKLSWQWHKVWKFEGTWVTTMPCHMWPPGWVTGPGSQGHWGFSKAKTANRRSLGNQGRCHLQKSVRRYSQSQLSTDNQNAFALLGTNLSHSSL
jgi:hypothetical protein